jgi:hypothetical protein
VLFETLNSHRVECEVGLVVNGVKYMSDGMKILKVFIGLRMCVREDCRNVLLNGRRESSYESSASISLETF